MAEKIVNGAFTSNLSSWTNVGAYSFVWQAGFAHAESDPVSGSYRVHKLDQAFSVSGSCVSALVNAYVMWDAPEPPPNRGTVVFYLRLIKPDATLVELASATYNGTSSGVGWLANALNIAAHITQVGTYVLRLEAQCSSGWHLEGDEPVYVQSTADYDNISVVITERFTKTVLEGIGGGELVGLSASKTVLEGAGLAESLTSVGGGGNTMLKFEKCGLYETLAKAVSVAKLEGAGLHETLTRTYGYRQRDIPGIPFVAGLKEFLRARWQEGNVTIERELVAEADIWTDLAPAETDWETI